MEDLLKVGVITRHTVYVAKSKFTLPQMNRSDSLIWSMYCWIPEKNFEDWT